MRPLIAFPLLLSLSLSASEPSVFGAGDLNNPNPYGLTNEEKLILENKKELQTVIQKHNLQSSKVESVSERIDGLQGIVEGLSETNNKLKYTIQNLQESTSQAEIADANRTETITDLQKQVMANTENIGQIKGLLEELSRVVDGIQTNYVTKEDFSGLIKQLKVAVPTTGAVLMKTDNGSIEKEAYVLFEQKKYVDAQHAFELMVQKKYKIPEAYYMIGESYFGQKNYKDAMVSYKESAARNDKALYMPTLLLHSGISMEKTGDTNSAKAFYQATVVKFGSSGAAKEANERLSKLK
ncbi:MAG: tetratricopeptide repeat protein [Sulfuricurvum sp.]|jgi:TolA-binding protein|uniref:tetratricopeptide repeat protein n=1 Tax=Sulfuricurvum sp. TaxID=2025608 RepID=UPI0025FACE3D|nr:tetratricopeptide repeat protein [Sulfuricurvum sp.]MCK9373833.1 tetratricopeptide repeat protein [Sulfuricurvum sp.]